MIKFIEWLIGYYAVLNSDPEIYYFDEWFREIRYLAFYSYGAEVTIDDQGGYHAYFSGGWSPRETCRYLFGAKLYGDL